MNPKLKCLVIDDEPVAIDILVDYVKKVPFLDLAGSFRNAVKAITFLQTQQVDLLFLDINMPDISGIQLLKALDKHPLVIFTTAYSQYAVESYNFEAVDYLLKPIEFDRFLKAVNRAFARSQNGSTLEKPAIKKTPAVLMDDDKSIVIKSGLEYHRIDIDDIYYIKATGNYATFITVKKEIMALITMKDVLSRLPKNRFFRIHKSYIINFRHVDIVDIDEVKIRKQKIPIGDAYREDFFKVLNQ